MKMLDANFVLRFILQDNADMANQAANEINSSVVYVSDAVLAEVVHVLTKTYKIERDIVANAVLVFTRLKNVDTANQNVVEQCMKYYKETSLDFVDCLLCAYHTEENYEICTFDKKLLKLIKREDNKNNPIANS